MGHRGRSRSGSRSRTRRSRRRRRRLPDAAPRLRLPPPAPRARIGPAPPDPPTSGGSEHPPQLQFRLQDPQTGAVRRRGSRVLRARRASPRTGPLKSCLRDGAPVWGGGLGGPGWRGQGPDGGWGSFRLQNSSRSRPVAKSVCPPPQTHTPTQSWSPQSYCWGAHRGNLQGPQNQADSKGRQAKRENWTESLSSLVWGAQETCVEEVTPKLKPASGNCGALCLPSRRVPASLDS